MHGKPNARDQAPRGSPETTIGGLSCAEQLDRFVALVLADVSLHEMLRSPDDTDQFIALVLQVARDCGFQLDEEGVRGAMRRRLPGIGCLSDGEVRETRLPPGGWLPVGASWRDLQLYLQWSHFGQQRLREPFFEGNVQRCQFKPFNRLFRYSTPIVTLAEWLAAHPGLRPTGFIFHMSRCGSTLLAQMLSALDRNIVISEASPIDDVVRARDTRPDLGDEQHGRWLEWMIGALGQPRSGDERHYFIKLDCWHTLALPLFRRVFPDVPWIFLYRDPVEVLVSQIRMPGIQMIPGMLGPWLALEPSGDGRTPGHHCARVLARICEPVLKHYSKGTALLVNYRELPQALWTTIMPHFGLDCSAGDRDAMADVARYDAKAPSLQFTPDVEAKQREASEATRAVAEQRLGEVYRSLERISRECN